MIRVCCPSRIVLSEIGEELQDCVRDLARLIELGFGVPCSVGMMGNWGEEVVSLAPRCSDSHVGSSPP